MSDRLPYVWGATRAEAERDYPADDLVPDGRRLTRAVSVTAPVDLVFRWTCQLHRAPYSYDVIDNLARRSPATAMDLDLSPGDSLMSVFRLTAVEPGRMLTALNSPRAQRLLGRQAVTYSCEQAGTYTRLVARLTFDVERLRVGVEPFAWGDLLMMRKQLRTLKRYAERDARAAKADRSAPRPTVTPLTLSARPDARTDGTRGAPR